MKVTSCLNAGGFRVFDVEEVLLWVIQSILKN